jgi:hypothetical protein
MRRDPPLAHHSVMTSNRNSQAPSTNLRTGRRLAATVLAAAIGLGTSGAAFGVLTSPGPRAGTARQAELAIPGVRGTGGGGGSSVLY